MTQKRDMTNSEQNIYQKTHNSEHSLQGEDSKKRREKLNAALSRRKHPPQLKQELNKIAHPEDIEDWDDDHALEAYEFMAEREVRNAKAQKQRMKRLAARRHEVENTD